ncbi:MAG: DUF2141 domain-containing protein [Halocynthiibacter sp.]
MPSNMMRLTAAVATIALTVGGAYLASGLRYVVPVANASTTEVETAAGYQISIHDTRSDQGTLVILAFDDPDAFDALDYKSAAGYLEIPADAVPLRVDFPDLTEGYHAFFILHDENGDYELNFEGELPSEGYAVSGTNDAEGAPVFDYSAVAPGMHDLTMRYWLP